MSNTRNKIVIVDFGSQTAHLIGRRLSDLGVSTELMEPATAMKLVKKERPAGIIFSGGPAGVYEKHAPTINKAILSLGIPVLGICYGWQLTAHLLSGDVRPGKKEYGPAKLYIEDFSDLFYGLPDVTRVFESHGDSVFRAPKGFKAMAGTSDVTLAAVKHPGKKIYGLQFHPEADDTKLGREMLLNFVTRVCRMPVKPKRPDTKAMISEIREKVGNRRVIGAISGGTDSTVAGVMVARAVGRQFLPVYVDSGLMREETLPRVQRDYPKLLGVRVKIIRARQEFLKRLKGVVDPEAKRKVIGRLYIELFEKEMAGHNDMEFLLQGTTYADWIESRGSKLSATIKSHHNVGGLPKRMRLKLLEPLKYYYTDEVRKIGLKLGIPRGVVCQQPFPGPGQAVRIMGEVTPKRLRQQVQADNIVTEELQQAGIYDKIFQSFSVMTGANSTAVKGDSRFYGEVVAVRVYTSRDRMTADWARLPVKVLAGISSRIVNEVPDISRVVYDITSKPPATMEWE